MPDKPTPTETANVLTSPRLPLETQLGGAKRALAAVQATHNRHAYYQDTRSEKLETLREVYASPEPHYVKQRGSVASQIAYHEAVQLSERVQVAYLRDRIASLERRIAAQKGKASAGK